MSPGLVRQFIVLMMTRTVICCAGVVRRRVRKLFIAPLFVSIVGAIMDRFISSLPEFRIGLSGGGFWFECGVGGQDFQKVSGWFARNQMLECLEYLQTSATANKTLSDLEVFQADPECSLAVRASCNPDISVSRYAFHDTQLVVIDGTILSACSGNDYYMGSGSLTGLRIPLRRTQPSLLVGGDMSNHSL